MVVAELGGAGGVYYDVVGDAGLDTGDGKGRYAEASVVVAAKLRVRLATITSNVHNRIDFGLWEVGGDDEGLRDRRLVHVNVLFTSTAAAVTNKLVAGSTGERSHHFAVGGKGLD